jgi:hypothetical protein
MSHGGTKSHLTSVLLQELCGKRVWKFSIRKFVIFFLLLEHYNFPALRIHNLRSFIYPLVFSEILLKTWSIPISLSYEDEVKPNGKGQIDRLLIRRMCTQETLINLNIF